MKRSSEDDLALFAAISRQSRGLVRFNPTIDARDIAQEVVAFVLTLSFENADQAAANASMKTRGVVINQVKSKHYVTRTVPSGDTIDMERESGALSPPNWMPPPYGLYEQELHVYITEAVRVAEAQGIELREEMRGRPVSAAPPSAGQKTAYNERKRLYNREFRKRRKASAN